jgi:hypothetical protein
VRARAALSQDRVLAPLNLFVRVELGVATLSGPVPSKGLGEHAVAVLKAVKGIYEVRNDLRVTPADLDDVVEGVLQGIASNVPLDLAPVPSGLEDPGSGLRGSLRGHPDGQPPAPRWTAHPEFPGREREDWVPPASRSPSPSTVALGAPVDFSPRPLQGRGGTVPGRNVSQTGRTADDLRIAVEGLRAGDTGFHQLRAEVREGVVILSGRVARADSLMKLAQAISRLPSVRRVDLLQVEIR